MIGMKENRSVHLPPPPKEKEAMTLSATSQGRTGKVRLGTGRRGASCLGWGGGGGFGASGGCGPVAAAGRRCSVM